MIVVGLTGGIGSGKTTVLQLFKDLGVSCYIADVEAKKLMNSSKIIRRHLVKEFGADAYQNNKLNRKYIANIVFDNPEKLKVLNSIVHPKVHKHFLKFIKKAKGKYIVYENAILFESGSYKMCNYIITVTAPLDKRIQRVIKRDNVTKTDVLNRIKNQISEEEKIKKSDFVIVNTDLKKTAKLVVEIHDKILKKIAKLK